MCESLWSHRLQHTRLTSVQISEVQSISRVWLSVTPWSAALQASISITNSQSLLKLISIESVMPSNHLIFCRPYLLPPSIFPRIRVFTNESVHHLRWPKYWSFSFSISTSSEYLGLISFRMDWLDLLAVQGTLKNLLQHHSSEASTLWKWKWKWSHSVMSNSLQPHGVQKPRLPCPSQTPRACSNSCWWCHPTISPSVIPFSSCLQSFPASGSFLMSQLFITDGQSTGVSASTSVLPKNIQDWFPLR